MKEMSLTPNASPSDDKKSAAFKKLIEKGKQVGHLSTQDIDTLIVDLDLDVDELEKLNEQIDAAKSLALLMIFRQRHLTESALKLICLRKQMQLKLLLLMIMPQWMIL